MSFLYTETLTIGASVAIALLGVVVWARRPYALGNVLYALLALVLSFWTGMDWLLRLSRAIQLVDPLALSLTFYLSVCVAPTLVAHAASYSVQRPFRKNGWYWYSLSFFAFTLFATSLFVQLLQLRFDSQMLFSAGIGLALLLSVVALLLVALELYPLLFAEHVPLLMRRRSAYGLLLFIPIVLGVGFQLISGPVSPSLTVPLLAFAFIAISLLAFLRASLLQVEFSSLEAFYLVVISFALVLMLNARNVEEATTFTIGLLLLGSFGAYAIRTFRGEKQRRLSAEALQEKLKQLDRAKSEFVDFVAHQLRGPLGGIRAAAEMLRRGEFGKLPTKVIDVCDGVSAESSRLLSLAETFLNASRLELETYASERVITDVQSVIDRLLRQMLPLARAKGVVLRTVARSPLPKEVQLDRTALENILYNLLDNAIKYTSHGSVTLTTAAERGEIVVDVVDTGRGITSEELTRLFKKFHRGQSEASSHVSGAGVGLYVTEQLARAARGAVTVESSGIGQGSMFSMRLPYSS